MQIIHTKINAKKSLLYTFPFLAVTLFTFALATIYNIYGALNSSAIDPSTGSNVFTVNAANSLGVSVADSTTLDIQPTSGGAFNSAPLTVYVETDNEYGYTLSMTTTTPDLKRTTPLSDGTVPTIETLASGSSFTSDTFTTNRWGYTLDNTNYYAIPGSVIINSAGTSGNYEDNPNVITFAAKLDNATPSGNYLTTINFIATANAPSNLNDFDTAFIFAGKTKYNGYYKMQDMTANICSYVATPTTTTSAPSTQLIDARDNKIYWISKLKDGNCWMTQNLDLNLDSTVALTSADTDLNSVTSWTPTRSTIDSTAYNNTTSGASGGILTYNGSNSNGNFASGWTNDNNTPYSADPGYRYVVPKEMSGSNTNWYDNGDTFYYCANQDTTCGGNSENGHYTMGNFYNFAAANATNNVETTLGGSANVVQNASMPDSICPKGWRLPIDKTTNKEFNTLLSASNYNVTSNFNFAGLNAIRTAPLYFVRSGNVGNGALVHAGVIGRAWTSTIGSSTNGYSLYFESTSINPAGNGDRLDGFPVRCLARTSISDLTYMQDFASLTDTDKTDVINSMLPETTYTLKDKRDNQDYTIAKLKDGKVWMTKNLNLAGGTALYSDTSDVPSGYPSSASTPYYVLPDSSIAGFSDYQTAYTYNSDSTICSENSPCYSYYSWRAATAQSGQGLNMDEDASYSVCPNGWKLPSKNDFTEMANSIGYPPVSNIINALAMTKGFIDANGFAGTSYYYAWSSTMGDWSGAYALNIGGDLYINYAYGRSAGMPVRCLLK